MIALDLNSGADLAIIAGGIGVLLSGVGWLLKHYKDSILAEVQSNKVEVLAEVKPNGGDTDTIGDRIVRIELHQVRNAKRIRRIERHLSDHVAADLEVQARASQALIDGQNNLLKRLAALEDAKK